MTYWDDPEEADRPRMTMRVYEVNRAGIIMRRGPVREVRATDSCPDFNAIAYPPCECARCTAKGG